MLKLDWLSQNTRARGMATAFLVNGSDQQFHECILPRCLFIGDG